MAVGVGYWFASSSFWLPEGVDWSDLHWNNNCYLHAVPWLALALMLLRRVVESSIGFCCSGLPGLQGESRCSAPPHNDVLHREFEKKRRPSPQQEEKLSVEIGWSQYRVHRWFWRARNWRKPSTITKFTESCWRLVFYSAAFVYGFIQLPHYERLSFIQQPFFWDLTECYSNYPQNYLPPEVLSYWCLQLAFYCSLFVSQFTDVKRKDFAQMMLHHGVTVCLLLLCYWLHHVQLGCLILLTHDASDGLLELAKLLNYTKREFEATVAFTLFAVVFFVTRLVVFPFWLVYSAVFDLPMYAGAFSAHKYVVLLLLILQALHIYWFKLIVSMALRKLNGADMKDARSGTEPSSCEECDERKQN